ncbi:MAG: hypothetical protein ACXWQQ_08270, partial [Pseudobdellovibrio sp.]
SATEDSSTSGVAASSIGGAIAASDSSGNVALNKSLLQKPLWSMILQSAQASGTACPKIVTTAGSGCTNAGSDVDLTYSSCSFGSSAATWSGLLEVSLSGGGTITCGTFPSPVSANIQRQFVSSHTVPGSATRTTARGTVEHIDHSTADLGNFDNQAIATNIGTGYGTVVTFDGSGKRTGVSVKQRIYVTGGLDHSVVGSVSLSETGTSRTASGSLTIYHNKLKVIATSTFTNVVYNDTACTPVSGSISTAFTAGTASPTALGSLLVGKSETLTFNGDGTATLVDYNGSSSTVSLTHCY